MFDSAESRSERNDLEEGAGGSARGKGIEGERTAALRRMTLLTTGRGWSYHRQVHVGEAQRRLCPGPCQDLSRETQLKELPCQKCFLQVLMCEFRARAWYPCTHKGREPSALLSARSQDLPCTERRAPRAEHAKG